MEKALQYISCQTCHRPAGDRHTKSTGTCFDCSREIIAAGRRREDERGAAQFYSGMDEAETVQAYRSAQIDALNALTLNLAMLVRRLVRKMHKCAPTDPIIQQAMDFLVTNGLQGSVLRAEARESERCAKGYCQHKRSDHNDGFEGCTFRGDDQDGHCVCSAFSEEMNLCSFCLADVRDCTCKH